MRVMLAAVLGAALFTTAASADERGVASYYTNPYHPGMIAAHKSLPFGTRVQVTNRHNGRSVVVRVNDRGPFVRGRVIDVTPAAASALGFSGLAPVSLAVLR